jgi:GTP cyclohydrolase IA
MEPDRRQQLETVAHLLLQAIGEDPTRPGLVDTPTRFAQMWGEFIEYQPGKLTYFDAEEQEGQMVTVSGMGVWSLCEHHLLPFYCEVAVGYIPYERLLGLSKLGRLAQAVAHRLQVQERLVKQLADAVEEAAGTEDVAVHASGVHLCMTMRGVEMPATMTTTVTRGSFRDDPATRSEFLRGVELGGNVKLTP